MENEKLRCVFSQRLRESRKKKSLTQEKLSELSDVAVAQISKLERGICCCGLDTAWRLAAALEVRIGWLVGEESEGPPPLPLEALGLQASRLGKEAERFLAVLQRVKQ